MTVTAWCLWLVIIVAPWLACAITAFNRPSIGRTATQSLGMTWCLAAVALIAVVDSPVKIVAENWFVLPASPTPPVILAWTIDPIQLWAVATSGLVLWWLAGSEPEESASPWMLVQILCGVAAQTWFLDNAWLLIIAQAALTGMCALLIGWRGDGSAMRGWWMSSAWGDGVMLLAVLSVALPLGSLRLTDLANADRMAELQLASPGTVPLVGLLLGIALCGRLFQFPFSAARDLSDGASPLANGIVWGLALCPTAMRWLFASRVWWTATDVVADLAEGWSAIAALAAAWCALATSNLRVRVTWLLGTQVSYTVPALIHGSAVDVGSPVVEQWCISLGAAAWLFVVLSREDAVSTASTMSTKGLIWFASLGLCGVAVWPVFLDPLEAWQWPQIVTVCAWGLCGWACVMNAADAGVGRLSARALWGSAWLVVAPCSIAFAAVETGQGLMSAVESPSALAGWSVVVCGMLAGVLWHRCPLLLRTRCRAAWDPLLSVGRQRFLMPMLFNSGVNLPIRGVAQLCRFLEWFVIDAWLLGTLRRLQRPSSAADELQAAGAGFYALALGLTAAALTLTIMWLAV
jgi:hypothetical protein